MKRIFALTLGLSLLRCFCADAQTPLFEDNFNGVARNGKLFVNTEQTTSNVWRIDPRNQQYQGRTLFAYDPINNRDDLLDQPNIITQGSDTFVRLYAESYYRHTQSITEENPIPGQPPITTIYGPNNVKACRGDQIRTVTGGNQGYFPPPTTTLGLEAEARMRVFPSGTGITDPQGAPDSDPKGVVGTLYFYGNTQYRPNDPAPSPNLGDEIDYENFGNRADNAIGATTFNDFPVDSGDDGGTLANNGVQHISHVTSLAGFNRRAWHWVKIQWLPRFDAAGNPVVVNGKQQGRLRWLVSKSPSAISPSALPATDPNAYVEVHSTIDAVPDQSMRVHLHTWIPASNFPTAYSGTLLTAQTPAANRRFFMDCDKLTVRNIAVPTDKVPPVVSITSPLFDPAFEYRYRSTFQATGSASDPVSPNRTGLKSVAIRLYRATSANNTQSPDYGFKWWNGTAWTSSPAEVPITFDAQGRWTFAMPPTMAFDTQKVDYRIRAVARDGAGNVGFSSAFDTKNENCDTFSIQNDSAPLVILNNPVNASTLSALAAVDGTVQDANIDLTKGTIFFRLRRDDNGYYWNGSTFIPPPTPLTSVNLATTKTGYDSISKITSWQKAPAVVLPTAAQLVSGVSYTVMAIATDEDTFNGNPAPKSSSDAASFSVDKTPPVVTVTTPMNEQAYSLPLTATGTATDNSSVSSVTVALWRKNATGVAEYYLGGTSWGSYNSSTAERPTTLSSSNWNFALPATLTSDAYFLRPTARDAAGNQNAQAPSVHFYLGISVMRAADIATGSDNNSRVTFNNPNPSQNMTTLPFASQTPSDFGPVSGSFGAWTPNAISLPTQASDGASRVLWTLNDTAGGHASLWKVAAAGQTLNSPNEIFGAGFPGWMALDNATNSDNQTHILWRDTANSLSLWRVDANGTTRLAVSLTYNYAGWVPLRVSVGGDKKVRVLWWHDSSKNFSIWRGTADGNYDNVAYEFAPDVAPDPLGTWMPTDIATASDDTTRVLFLRANGAMKLWRVGTTGTSNSSSSIPPPLGYEFKAISVGADGNTRVLLRNTNSTNGRILVWVYDTNLMRLVPAGEQRVLLEGGAGQDSSQETAQETNGVEENEPLPTISPEGSMGTPQILPPMTEGSDNAGAPSPFAPLPQETTSETQNSP